MLKQYEYNNTVYSVLFLQFIWHSERKSSACKRENHIRADTRLHLLREVGQPVYGGFWCAM